MTTEMFLEMSDKVAKKLGWSKTNMYVYIKGWWEKRPIPFSTPIYFN